MHQSIPIFPKTMESEECTYSMPPEIICSTMQKWHQSIFVKSTFDRPKDVVRTVFWGHTQNQCLACGL